MQVRQHRGPQVRSGEPRRRFAALEYLQAREADLVRQPFFARYDPEATWLNDLKPLTERDERFFPHLRKDDAAEPGSNGVELTILGDGPFENGNGNGNGRDARRN